MELLQFSFFLTVPDCVIARWGIDLGSIFCMAYNTFLCYFYFCILKFTYTVIVTQLKGGNRWTI